MTNVSRRKFLKLMGMTTVGLTLAACALSIAPVTNPEEEVVPMTTHQTAVSAELLTAFEASLRAE